MTSEAVWRLSKGPHHISNMHMDKKVIGVTGFKSDLRDCLENVVAPRVCQKGPYHISNMQMQVCGGSLNSNLRSDLISEAVLRH